MNALVSWHTKTLEHSSKPRGKTNIDNRVVEKEKKKEEERKNWRKKKFVAIVPESR